MKYEKTFTNGMWFGAGCATVGIIVGVFIGGPLFSCGINLWSSYLDKDAPADYIQPGKIELENVSELILPVSEYNDVEINFNYAEKEDWNRWSGLPENAIGKATLDFEDGELVVDFVGINFPVKILKNGELVASIGDNDGNTLIISEDDDSKVFCPECQKQGLKSRVYVDMCLGTAVAGVAYYDENGEFQYDDPNSYTYEYHCSNGHEWNETTRP